MFFDRTTRSFTALGDIDDVAKSIELYIKTALTRHPGQRVQISRTGYQWILIDAYVHEPIGEVILQQTDTQAFQLELNRNRLSSGLSMSAFDWSELARSIEQVLNHLTIASMVSSRSKLTQLDTLLSEKPHAQAKPSLHAEARLPSEQKAPEQQALSPAEQVISDQSLPLWEQVPEHRWDREALQLWHEGHSCSEIAARIKQAPKTIRNKLTDLRNRYGTEIVPLDENRE